MPLKNPIFKTASIVTQLIQIKLKFMLIATKVI